MANVQKITIDGVQIETREGQSVLQAAKEHGIHIPHFCYHPCLQVAGNCRMCLVEIEKVPKLQIACGTPVREGMVIHTQTEKVIKARRAVLEFLLIHHPLDCPICDKSGECKLQDYCFEFGSSQSRFREEKRAFPKQGIGATVVRDMNRCLHCTRCLRYLRDVAGCEEFSLSERGGHTQMGTYIEAPMLSPFSMNIIELCPVGALTCRPFRFKSRAWLMQKTRTVCPSCSRGCNVVVWSRKDKVLRMTPAENQKVNRVWLCDRGRMSTERVHSPDRLLQAMSRGKPLRREKLLDETAAILRRRMDSGDAGSIGIIGSGQLTNEEAYLIRKMANGIVGTKALAFILGEEDPRPFQPSNQPLPEWLIRRDTNPNSRGVRDMGLTSEGESGVRGILERVIQGKITVLFLFHADLPLAPNSVPGLTDALKKLDFLFVTHTHETETGRIAHVLLPEASFAEKEGSFTNEGGRVQWIRKAIEPIGESLAVFDIVIALARRLGANWNDLTSAAVLGELAASIPGYQGLSVASIPAEGIQLPLTSEENKAEGTSDA